MHEPRLPPGRFGAALGAAFLLCATPAARGTEASIEPIGIGASHAGSNLPDFRVLGSEVAPGEDWRWWGGFSLPVLDGRVRALTVFRGELVAAGSFEMAGGRRANHVARWRDGKWEPLGAGLDGEVYALAVFQDRLIAGCQYTSSGGGAVGPMACWDGGQWTALGVPVSGWVAGIVVYSLLVDGATLVAGGAFDRMAFQSGNPRPTLVPTSNIARWDGSAWTAIGAGFDGPVTALGSYRGELVAAGDFLASGVTPVTRIARWDGAEWRPLGGGIPGVESPRVSALAELRDTLYAGGGFDGRRPLLRFGGATWDAIPGSWLGHARVLQVDGDSLIVAGTLLRIGDRPSCVQAWNGSSWALVGETPWPIVESMTRYRGRLVCGGYLTSYWTGDGEPASHVVEWNGASWNTLERPSGDDRGLQGYVQSLLRFEGGLVAAGSFRFSTESGWSPTYPVARWNGERWNAMDDSLQGRATSLALFRGDVIVGGNLHRPGSGIDGIARWDAGRWQPLAPGLGGVVEALAVLRDTLYASGGLASAQVSLGVARYDGMSWHSIGELSGGGGVFSMGAHRGELFAGGLFDAIGGVTARNVARWDGAGWHGLGSGVNLRVNALASADSELIVAGDFYLAGDTHAYGLALWNGSAWRSFPGVVAQNASALLVWRGQVFAGAHLLLRQVAPGIPAGTDLHKVARWDGYEWHALGSGANGRLMTLAELNGGLFVGGDLTEAGGRASFRIARWALAPRASPGDSPVAWETATPNPLSGSGTRLEFSLAEHSSVRLSIHDLAGREVARLVSGTLEAGFHVLRWSGLDREGRRLPSGVYYARLAAGGARANVKRLVLIR